MQKKVTGIMILNMRYYLILRKSRHVSNIHHTNIVNPTIPSYIIIIKQEIRCKIVFGTPDISIDKDSYRLIHVKLSIPCQHTRQPFQHH